MRKGSMKKSLALLVALLLLATAFVTACGNDDGATDAGDGNGAVTDDADDADEAGDDAAAGGHLTISMAKWNIGEKITDPEVDLILGYLYDRFNFTIDPVHVTWDDYIERIPVWAATGQLPDWFAIDAFGRPFLAEWINEEIIRPLPADLSRWPYVQDLVAQFEGMRHENGNFYGLPRISFVDPNLDLTNRGILIRRDWMEYLGYDPDAPVESLDAFIEMIQDLMENNPEQRGDVAGITFIAPWSAMNLSQPWHNAFLSAGGSPWVRDGDRWNQAGVMPGARDAVAGVGRMWEAGILDRDLAIMQEGQGIERFSSGRAVAYVYNMTPSALRSQVADFFALTYPDREFADMVTGLRLWNADGGAPFYQLNPGFWSESYFNAEISDEAMYRILDMKNFLLSREGQILFQYGIEGIDFEFVNGEPVSLRTTGLGTDYEILNDWGWFVCWQNDADFTNTLAWGEDVIGITQSYLNWWLENGRNNAEFQDPRNTFIIPPAQERVFWMIHEDFVSAITSADPLATWDAAVETYLAGGGQEVIDEFNEIARERGITP